MAHGGYRPGSGRKPGSVTERTKKTREAEDRAIAEGVTPLEVMLDNMRFYHQDAAEALAKLLGGDLPQVEAEDGEDPERLSIIEGIKNVLGLRKAAGEEAARAAPYVHARMGYAAGDSSVPDDDFIPLAERLKAYQRRDDLKAAGDKVVELKPQGDQWADTNGSGPIRPPII